jgi:hypothetical protein
MNNQNFRSFFVPFSAFFVTFLVIAILVVFSAITKKSIKAENTNPENVAVADKTAALLDISPQDWKEGLFSISDESRHVRIFTGEGSIKCGSEPRSITVYINDITMPNLNYNSRVPTESQKIVYAAYLRWCKATKNRRINNEVLEQNKTIATFLSQP